MNRLPDSNDCGPKLRRLEKRLNISVTRSIENRGMRKTAKNTLTGAKMIQNMATFKMNRMKRLNKGDDNLVIKD